MKNRDYLSVPTWNDTFKALELVLASKRSNLKLYKRCECECMAVLQVIRGVLEVRIVIVLLIEAFDTICLLFHLLQTANEKYLVQTSLESIIHVFSFFFQLNLKEWFKMLTLGYFQFFWNNNAIFSNSWQVSLKLWIIIEPLCFSSVQSVPCLTCFFFPPEWSRNIRGED